MKYFKQITDLPTEINLMDHLTPEMIQCLNDYGQIGINSIPGHENDYTLGIGSLDRDWKNLKITSEKGIVKYNIPDNKSKRLHERNFTVLCDIFKNTPFEEIYNTLGEKYLLGRVRIFKSDPKTCLTWHDDGSSPRIHYPMKTQMGCFMVIEDEVKHLGVNEWWWTDTRKLHTAFNASKESRIHLVGVIRGEK